MPGLRRDPLSGRELLVAPGRDRRPHEAAGSGPHRCPFCRGNETDTPQAILELRRPGDETWSVRVVPNLYPIVAGRHEVVIETPEHEADLAQRPADELLLILQTYRDRYRDLMGQRGNRYVTVFRNRGAAAGTSLTHPHSQVVALPRTPREVLGMARRWRRHFRRHASCLLCDSIAAERRERQRMLYDAEGCVAFVAPGGPYPGEIVLAPSGHAADFGSASDVTLAAFGGALSDVLRRLRAEGDLDYNLLIRTWPETVAADPALHWYAAVIPRTAVAGGFELATGIWVAPLAPEDAARGLLRP